MLDKVEKKAATKKKVVKKKYTEVTLRKSHTHEGVKRSVGDVINVDSALVPMLVSKNII